MDPILLAVARPFAAKVKANFDTPTRARHEDLLKPPVVELSVPEDQPMLGLD